MIKVEVLSRDVCNLTDKVIDTSGQAALRSLPRCSSISDCLK